jgi:ElaB/YqjD/DUF883 family membrane-anchored ribosome-binding protein
MDANGLNKDDFSAPKNDFKNDVGDSKRDAKGDMKDIKDDARDLKSDLKGEIKDLKNDLKSDAASAAKKIKNAGGKMREEIMHGVDLKKVLEAGKSLGESIDTQINTQPYIALGVAAVAGFGVGCVLGSRIGRIALGIGVTVAARKILEEVDFRALANKAFAV